MILGVERKTDCVIHLFKRRNPLRTLPSVPQQPEQDREAYVDVEIHNWTSLITSALVACCTHLVKRLDAVTFLSRRENRHSRAWAQLRYLTKRIVHGPTDTTHVLSRKHSEKPWRCVSSAQELASHARTERGE